MSEFNQREVITTLHDLNPQAGHDRVRRLCLAAPKRKIGLILPALYSDLMSDAMRGIVESLREVNYLDRIVVAVTFLPLDLATDSGASRAEVIAQKVQNCEKLFEDFTTRVEFLWINSAPIQGFLRELETFGLSAGPNGKGRTVWLSMGYLLAHEVDVMLLHDCDIVTYDADILSRLAFPLVIGRKFKFAKGYYARARGKFYGRVMRLLVTPLLRAMDRIHPNEELLRYMLAFKYPLAGEFGVSSDVAANIRFPGDWGLEVGTLAEIKHHCQHAQICQVELGIDYDHKHQRLTTDQGGVSGLVRMAKDISLSLLRTMAARGVAFDPEILRATYDETARLLVAHYQADAEFNALVFDQHQEEQSVDKFSDALRVAIAEFEDAPTKGSMIPSWSRVLSANPSALEEVHRLVGRGPESLSENP